ncbi:Ig-like domain-containing protein [Scopulibacillus cellulosilyticus]|uniref:Ig-like domain-containing protein n=1 Tax=Scopulibacillus cellulosilyticus TaxID=2665665 RepID=A0ABW2Q180_9BACL
MNKKGILSLIGIGVLASSLSLSPAHAQTHQHKSSKAELQNQVQSKLLKPGYLSSHKINQFNSQSVLKGIQSSKDLKGKRTFNGSGNKNKNDFLTEIEPNDDFTAANTLPLDQTMVGQLLPYYDVDFYKVKVPKGTLVIGGMTNTSAIDLMYAAVEKDFKDNGNLEILDIEYQDGALFEAWKVNKAGTYYIGAYDDDGLDNTKNDLYALQAQYIDTAAPDKPAVNKVDNNDKVVTGKAEAYSTVTVKAGGKTLGSAKVSYNGAFSVKIKTQKAGTKLTVTAKDKAGNVSKAATVTVRDVVPPSKPTIYKIDDNDKVIKGKAEANAYITVKAKSRTIGTGKADSKGYYSVKIKSQKAGTNVYVYAKDKAGNVSKAAVRKVVKH